MAFDNIFSITAITSGTPTTITVSPSMSWSTGQSVVISGSDSTPSIDGTHTITVLSSTQFTIATTTTGNGTTGKAYRVWFVDFGAGNDSNSGLNKANAWKTMNAGPTAARIAPGDVIRYIETAPTSLGSADWGSAPIPATKNISSSTNASPIVLTVTGHGYSTGDVVDVTGHTTNTNANGQWEINVLTSNTFELLGSAGNGVGGTTGTVRHYNYAAVRLASAVTAEIDRCEAGWVAATDVTVTYTANGNRKEGYNSQSIAVASGFTTGKIAYKALPGATDYSTYQQVSFWIRPSIAVASSTLSLRLCSDTTGDTSVNTIAIPALPAANFWVCLTVDLATALGASIQSVALYADSDPGVVSILLDNILACKASSSADSLTLSSLVGKNTDHETWYGIRAILGRNIILDMGPNASAATVSRGYTAQSGPENITTYKIQPFKTTMTTGTTVVQQPTHGNATATLGIYHSAGWNQTDMSIQVGLTWYDGQNGEGRGLYYVDKDYTHYDRLCATRYRQGCFFTGSSSNYVVIDSIHFNNNNEFGGLNGAWRNDPNYLHIGFACNNSSIGIDHTTALGLVCNGYLITNNNNSTGQRFATDSGTASGPQHYIEEIRDASNNGVVGFDMSNFMYVKKITRANWNVGIGVNLNGSVITIDEIVAADSNGTYGIQFAGTHNTIYFADTEGNTSGGVRAAGDSNTIRNLTTTSNGVAGISLASGIYLYGYSCTLNESTEVSIPTGYTNPLFFSQDHDATAGNHQIFGDGMRISAQTAVRHSPSGIAWKMSPTSAVRKPGYAVELRIARVACNANQMVTFKVWVQRDSTSLTGRIMCRGKQIAGVPTDVIATASASASTWEQLTLTFTPTAAGVVEVVAQCWGGTTLSFYVDDITITQG